MTLFDRPGMDDPFALLTELCAIPTAPFREHLVMAWVETFARKRRSLKFSRDGFGNTLLIRQARKASAGPRLIFVAHLDHPGMVSREMIDKKTLAADFRGGVMASFFPGVKVVFFVHGREVRGKIVDVQASESGRATGVHVRVPEAVPPNAIGMFDLTPGELRGGRFHGRVCDDLAGAASALAMLEQLIKKPADSDVGVLLTRGEEEGFIGSLAAVIEPKLLKKTDRIMSIECSAEQPVARQGEGVVLRVGDRTSTFHSAFTRFVAGVAQKLATRDSTFKFQRALMPGGTCEGTVFDAWGYVTAAACVPLGNYHNMDKPREKIAAENVHLDDWNNMVRLFVELAHSISTFDASHGELRATLGKLLEQHKPKLELRGTVHAGA